MKCAICNRKGKKFMYLCTAGVSGAQWNAAGECYEVWLCDRTECEAEFNGD